MNQLYDAIVVSGNYTGRKGKATTPNRLNLVMFYSEEGVHPYRMCLSVDEITYTSQNKPIFFNKERRKVND